MRNSILLLSFLFYCHLSFGQSTVTYSPDGTNINNPERGFYRHTETNSTDYSSLDVNTLTEYRSNGFTLILRVFYLNDFTESSISNSYLEKVSSDFQKAKQAGIKVIVRFAYTKKDSAPYGDASLENVLVHLNQLKPILYEHKDAIALVQAGFIGAWGEWYYTDHFSVQAGIVTEADWIKRRTFVDALLDAVPSSIMVQVRTPIAKTTLLQDEVALTTQEAFTDSKKARIAHHNDCFLASFNDIGTYVNIEVEKAYLEIETQYLVMGGETCGISPPYSQCTNALAELERFHWSYLNIDYHTGVLNSWRTDGCFDEIELSLGYRYKLLETTALTLSKPGGEYTIDISLDNDGWANVYNKRNLEIVLRNQSTQQEYFFKTNEDPRRWSLTSTTSINLTLGIPENIEEGNYSVYVSMPDNNTSLYSNPNYAVRMANTNTWDADLGYNDLGITLNISASNTANDYTGSDFLVERSNSSSTAVVITIDANASDWNNIPVAFSASANTAANDIKLYNDRENLYLGVFGSALNDSYQIFIDLDKSPDTGYHAWQWTNNGAELLIENGSLYTYSGTSNGWGWTLLGAINAQKNTNTLELSISLSQIGNVSSISYAYVNDPNNSVIVNYLPSQNASFLDYNLYLTDNVELFSGADDDRILLYWSNLDATFTRTVERSTDGGQFETIATLSGDTGHYLDFDVSTSTNYDYRFFLQNGENISTYSKIITETTDSGRGKYYQFTIDGNDNDWYAISPLSTQSLTSAYTLRTFWGSQNVNFMISGDQVDEYSIYIDTDDDDTTGGPVSSQGGNAAYDYLVHNDSLFQYSSGDWLFQNECTVASQDKSTELSFALSELTNLGDNQQINIAAYYNIGVDTVFLPIRGKKALYARNIPPSKVSNFGLRKSGDLPKSRLVITWDQCTTCDGYVLERSLDGIDFMEVGDYESAITLVQDNDLADNTKYYYRLFTYTVIGPSLYSDILSETTGEEVVASLDDSSLDDIKLYPNPVKNILHFESKDVSGAFQLQVISISGKVVFRSELHLSSNTSSISVDSLKKGVYLVVLKNANMILQRKIIKA